MWRLDRGADAGSRLAETASDDALHPLATAAPHAVSLGAPDVVVGNIADPVWQQWREQLAVLGGTSPLLQFSDGSGTRIELSTTHPGGLPQFITGKSTLLSHLIRDDLALRRATSAAGAITAKGAELRATRGIESVHLAIGLAQWRHDGEQFMAPVLLRPLAMRRFGRDFELKLRGKPILNPALARVLREQFQIVLDAEAFVALAMSNGVFKPQPVIDRLRGLTTHLPWFNVQPRLVVSSFADVAGAMLEDAAELSHPVLDALAGNPAARGLIEGAFEPVELLGQDLRSPSADALLLDADEEQENVVAQVAAGNSLVVKTLPGTGGTQTIVNSLGALIANNKRVLVVGPRRSSLDAITHQLETVGLQGVAVSPRTLRRDLIQSIARNEKAVRPNVADVDDALVRLRRVILDYRTSLTRTDPGLGVSVLDALTELARLSQSPVPPATTARLDAASLEALAGGRDEAARILVKAAALGEFRYGPRDSPWYGASFSSTAEATAAHELAKRLQSTDVPRLLERADALVGQTRMRRFESVSELGVYLRLLHDLRETLDKFVPAVFDRPLTELIAATASRRDSPTMSGANRRRLRKLALEYVRPGVHVNDLNEALQRIQQQRVLWQRYAAAGVVPHVPVGIADVQVAYQRVAEDLAVLDGPLARAGTATSLTALPIAELQHTLAGLAAESEVLQNLQERTALLAALRELDLAELLTDLSVRHVAADDVSAELELAWWQSALESMLGSERALLGANTAVLDRLESDFRLVDAAHASSAGQQLAWQLSERWQVGLVDHADEAERLKRLLRSDRATPHVLAGSAPNLARCLAPVWLVSPYEVPAIDPGITFDTVVLVDAGAMAIAECAGAIRRARQVVAFGDPVTQTPSPFELAVSETSEPVETELDVDALHASSALAQLGELLPVFTLTRSYRAGGEDLADLVNNRFYGGRIETLPWAGTFLGHGSLTLNYVDSGNGMPHPDTGAVESVDAEVAKVLDLVMEHAAERPRESLMVITASALHAVRAHQAVLAAATGNQELSDFVLADRPEPFTVVTLEQSVALSRDRVIFSIGYGRTPHGRVLSNFGGLALPGGDRLLAVGMSRARRSMDIVSCFRPDDIDESRMGQGVVALAQLLGEADAITSAEFSGEVRDPLLGDLAGRLERLGLSVRLDYRGVLPLVASHRGKAVAVETDPVIVRSSLRESLRLRPEVLRRLGWHYLRVHSFDLFADPESVAERIASLIGAAEQPEASLAG